MNIVILSLLTLGIFVDGKRIQLLENISHYDDTEYDSDNDEGSAGSATIPDNETSIKIPTRTSFNQSGLLIKKVLTNYTSSPPVLKGTECFSVFASSFGYAKLLSERNAAYEELKGCLKRGNKCSYKNCNEKLDLCMDHIEEHEKYKCWFFFFNCGEECNKH